MYQNDSFFDLSEWERVGLLCISAALTVLMILLARWLLRGAPVWVKLAGSLILFWIFVSASPQVYYMYYRMIIPDLPLQWVIWPPASVAEAARMLVFSGPQNLSAHGQGLLGWGLLIAPFLRRRRA